MSFFAQYPASAAGTNPSIGTNGAPAPSSSTEVAGVGPDGNLHPLSTNNSGVLNVDTTSAGGATAANQVLEITQLTNIDTAVTAESAAVVSRLSGSLVPTAYNEIDLTYIASGNGTGQVGTAVYKLASATVATLTLTYDASNRLSTVVKS